MDISSLAGQASTLQLLQSRGQMQVRQLKESSDQQQQAMTALLTGAQGPSPSDGRGSLIDLSV